MIWLAVSTSDGLVTEDYYKEGKAINRVIGREQRAVELGLSAIVSLEAAGHLVRVRLLSAGSDIELPMQLQVRFSHPTREGFDQTVLARRESSDVYLGSLQPLREAYWHVLVEDVDSEWRLAGRWHALQADGPLELVASVD